MQGRTPKKSYRSNRLISDLATELQIGVPELHEWIKREVIKSGRGSLDDGHWPTATEGQRAASIEHLGSKRLLIRFSQPDHDGQVKIPEHHRDDGTDNKIDGDAAIKLYDELVKSPEDRLALPKHSSQSFWGNCLLHLP